MTSPIDFQHGLFDMLLQSQYWPKEKLVAHQRSQLEQLLRHARAAAPFYEHRLDAVFRPDGSIDWDRWTEIPIVKRADLTSTPDAFLARTLPAGHGPTGTIKTSGTTGVPATIVFTQLAALASIATKWRADVWHSLDWSKTLYVRHGLDEAAAWPHGVALGAWGPPWDANARRGGAFRLNIDVPVTEQLAFMRRIGPSYIAPQGPKNAHSLASELDRYGQSFPLEAIFTSGEAITGADRDICRRAFRAEITDVYSSKEGNHMAHRCPAGACWHVNAETILLEIVDAEGRACPAGETGRIVITSFYSTAQPLIRYDHGDLGQWGTACECGRTLPVLRAILGRVRDMFHHPDGRSLARFLPDKYRVALKSSAWQFVQIGPNNYEVRYVPINHNEIGDEQAVAIAFREHFFDDASVRFRRVTELLPLASGKFMEYLNEYSPPPA